ncbi:predicted protein [Haematococcus lacustris]|uniref:CobW/HypB/UreG nucleotide-binding domain-containing protein n=1 Tax=Haematococcus lacustris TaxID=44745 RepID=A0A699Z5L2_HAELA|nr:predicted protein [Haematococcus lacustris]
MASVNIDQQLLSDSAGFLAAGEQLVALSNGCICCSIREDLDLHGVARLDTLVTVVDAQRFVKQVLEAESLQDKGMAVDEHDDRTVADLLVEQVEFANVLVLNKLDLVTAEEARQLAALLHTLNPAAKASS